MQLLGKEANSAAVLSRLTCSLRKSKSFWWNMQTGARLRKWEMWEHGKWWEYKRALTEYNDTHNRSLFLLLLFVSLVCRSFSRHRLHTLDSSKCQEQFLPQLTVWAHSFQNRFKVLVRFVQLSGDLAMGPSLLEGCQGLSHIFHSVFSAEWRQVPHGKPGSNKRRLEENTVFSWKLVVLSWNDQVF